MMLKGGLKSTFNVLFPLKASHSQTSKQLFSVNNLEQAQPWWVIALQ